MTDRPSAGARATTDIARLVDELRARTTRINGLPLNTDNADLFARAASALEAQARELAEAREKERVARIEAEHMRETSIANSRALNAAQTRIAALEDAARVKDEALRPLAERIDEIEQVKAIAKFATEGTAAVKLELLRRARSAIAKGEQK
jgi:vacuolar-type H+-ATPase subunit I/STV1